MYKVFFKNLYLCINLSHNYNQFMTFNIFFQNFGANINFHEMILKIQQSFTGGVW
jgi:hypothetical protein